MSEQMTNEADASTQSDTVSTVGSPSDLLIDQVAQADFDKSVFLFGVLPLIIVGVLAMVCVAAYFFRRGKSWNDLGEAIRVDDDGPRQVSGFSTRDLDALDPTKPSHRLRSIKKTFVKDDSDHD